MTYIDLINRFWLLDEQWQFSCCETRLYFLLLKTANRLGWENDWTFGSALALYHLGVSLKSFKAARNRLSQAGLISFSEGGKGRQDRTRYTILGVQNNTPKSTPKLPPKGTPKLPPKGTPSTIDKDLDKNKDIIPPYSPPFTSELPQAYAEFLHEMLHSESMIVACCKNNRIEPYQYHRLAAMLVEEWAAQGRAVDDDDCRTHFVNAIRKSAAALRREYPCARPQPDIPGKEAALTEEIRAVMLRDNITAPAAVASCNEFFRRWAETDRAGYMRCEKEQTWDTSKRLATWLRHANL